MLTLHQAVCCDTDGFGVFLIIQNGEGFLVPIPILFWCPALSVEGERLTSSVASRLGYSTVDNVVSS